MERPAWSADVHGSGNGAPIPALFRISLQRYAGQMQVPSGCRARLLQQLSTEGGVAVLVGGLSEERAGSDTEILFTLYLTTRGANLVERPSWSEFRGATVERSRVEQPPWSSLRGAPTCLSRFPTLSQ